MDDLTTLGWVAIDWIEELLCHGPGDVQGQDVEIDDEFAAFIVRAYELYPPGHPRAGRRVRNRAFLSRPKGRSKSGLAAWLAVFEALGPARFDGWDAAGDPVGRPVTSPEVLCFATEEDQAGNTYGGVSYILEHGRVADAYDYDIGRGFQSSSRVFISGGGSIEPMTSGAKSKDGGKSTFVIWDEVHLWTTPELKQLYHTTRRNLGKRKGANPWGLITSTMYGEGEESIAEELHAQHKKRPKVTLLFDHRQSRYSMAEIGEDDTKLLTGLTDAYGASAPWQDFDRIVEEEFRDDSVDLSESERYFLNRPQSSSQRWMDMGAYDARIAEVELDRGEAITVGFDGSLGTADKKRKADATVLRACRLSDGHLFTLGVWEPPGPGPWEPPRHEVAEALRRAEREYSLLIGFFDPQHWQSDLGEWAQELGVDRVLEWWTNRDVLMARALERLHTDITQGHITLDSDPQVRDHYRNTFKHIKRASRNTDPDAKFGRVLVKKEHPASPYKIDTVVADALALEARAHAIENDLLTKYRKRNRSKVMRTF